MKGERKRKIIGIGAGGHAKVLLEILELVGGYQVVGLLDADPKKRGTRVLGVPVIGDDRELAAQYRAGARWAFIGVGAVSGEGTRARARLFLQAREQGFRMAVLVHPSAVVSRRAVLGDGAAVLAGAVIGPEARLGDNAVVYSGGIVEHDSQVGPHALISPGVAVAGGVVIGEGAFVGIGASVIQGCRIGAWATVGAGAVVAQDVPAEARVAGVPARPMAARRMLRRIA